MSKVDSMAYELTGVKKTKSKNVGVSMAESVGSLRLLWILVNRHKVGILLVGNIVLVLNWAIPEWPTIVRSLF